jgi:hypothetical protein
MLWIGSVAMRFSAGNAWSWVLVLALLAFNPVRAADGEAAEIRAVIEAQLAAFAADDAAKAYSFASPAIQRMFGTPEDFLMMVRTAYPVVYRPSSVLFRPLQAVDGELIQVVQMSDADGRVWLALYKMQKQADGSWRIDGCLLRQAETSST